MLTEEQRKAIEAAATEIEYMHADLMGRGGFSSDGNANPCAQALRELLAAHSAGAQEPVGELVIGECKNGYSAPWLFRLFDGVQAKDGMQLYAQPQPLADAARDALINRARSALKGMVKWFGPYPEFIPDWPAQADAVKAAIGHAKVVLAEIERIEREESGK